MLGNTKTAIEFNSILWFCRNGIINRKISDTRQRHILSQRNKLNWTTKMAAHPRRFTLSMVIQWNQETAATTFIDSYVLLSAVFNNRTFSHQSTSMSPTQRMTFIATINRQIHSRIAINCRYASKTHSISAFHVLFCFQKHIYGWQWYFCARAKWIYLPNDFRFYCFYMNLFSRSFFLVQSSTTAQRINLY